MASAAHEIHTQAHFARLLGNLSFIRTRDGEITLTGVKVLITGADSITPPA